MGSTYIDVMTITSDTSLEYDRMAQAIKDLAEETGKPPVIFSLCQWGKVCTNSPIVVAHRLLVFEPLGTTMALGQAYGAELAREHRSSFEATACGLIAVFHRQRVT